MDDNRQSYEAEMGIFAYLLIRKDERLFKRLTESHFATPEGQEFFTFLKERGLHDPRMTRQYLVDVDKEHLVEYLNEIIRLESIVASIETNKSDYIKMLNEKLTERALINLSKSIEKNIKEGKPLTYSFAEIRLVLDKGLNSALHIQPESAHFAAVDTFNSSSLIGMPVGIKSFDDETGGLYRGSIITVAGHSGNMKTSSSLAFMRSFLSNHPKTIGIFFQIEMTQEEMTRYYMGQLGVRKNDITKGAIPIDTLKQIALEDPLANRFYYYTKVKHRINTIDDIEEYVRSHRADIFAIDYMSYMINTMPKKSYSKKDTSMNEDYIQFMTRLKELVQDTNSICLLICQSDIKALKFKKIDPRPNVGDIEWSQSIVHLSTYIYNCYYPIKYNRFQFPGQEDLAKRLFIQLWDKSRSGGKPYIIYEVDPTTGRFREPSDELRQFGEYHWTNHYRQFEGK